MSEADQLQEYETQLSELEELLQLDPNDESLLKLKSDLLELIALTKEDNEAGVEDNEAGVEDNEAGVEDNEAGVEDNEAGVEGIQVSEEITKGDGSLNEEEAPPVAAIAVRTEVEDNINSKIVLVAKKKLKKVKDFEAPSHLKLHETDTEKDRSRKKRAVKALKNKHREKQREYDSTKKQKSWQDFSKKGKGKRKDKSIFATQEGVKAKVGVVSGGSMTDFGERKRHKYN